MNNTAKTQAAGVAVMAILTAVVTYMPTAASVVSPLLAIGAFFFGWSAPQPADRAAPKSAAVKLER